MKTFRFDSNLTFKQAREALAVINNSANKHLIAHLVWLEGDQEGQEIVFLWDPYAQRFGHQIDKEMIEHRIIESLFNDISVEVKLLKPRHP